MFNKFLFVAGVNDRFDQPQRVGAFDLAANGGFQDFVINAGEVFANVALQNVTARSGEFGETAQSAMIAKSCAVGIRIVDERPLEDRPNYVAQGVMNHAVAVRRGGNHSLLRFEDFKSSIFARLVGFAFKLYLQLHQLFAQTVVESQHILLVPLAALRFQGRCQQVVAINYLWPQISVSFHFVFAD